MPTFLTTKRMSPELRRRIERSVSNPSGGERFSSGRTPTTVAVARLVIVLGILGVALALGWTFLQSRREFSSEQRALGALATQMERSISAARRARLAKIEPFIARSSARQPSDFSSEVASPEWRDPEARRRLLAEPVFYLRGDSEVLAQAEARRAAIAEGQIDAFPSCLAAPPTSEKESAHLRRIGVLAPMPVTPVSEAQALLAFSAQDLRAEATRAEHMRQLRELRSRLEGAQIAQRARAASARTLLLVIDEPVPRGVPRDFDGEAPHDVRVVLVDLDTGEEHLRVRRHVNPVWISEKSRLSASRALDSCKLARELHQGW